MKCSIIGKSVRGASHIANDTNCQDSFKKTKLSDGCSIIAIADGHGSSSCPHSKSGSIMAVNVFIDIMKELHDSYADKLDELSTYLNRDGELKIAQSIDFEWKKQVIAKHLKSL